MGANLVRSLFIGIILIKTSSILVMIETIWCCFQQLQQPPKVKAKGAIKCNL